MYDYDGAVGDTGKYKHIAVRGCGMGDAEYMQNNGKKKL